MKLFNAEQMYAADALTLERQGITSEELMERAAIQLFNWIHGQMQGAQVKIHIFCGIGNNGGDGLALARHLNDHGYTIAVYVVNFSKTRSKDFLHNLDRLKDRKIWPEFLEMGHALPAIGKEDIIIDAIFGIGLNRPPAEWVCRLMQHLQQSEAFVLSVDVPSGLYAGKGPLNENGALKSNYVLSIQVPKLAFFLPETGKYVEQWEVLNIGLDPEYMRTTETVYELMGKSEVLPYYVPRKKFSHKGTYGHSLIIGGSYGKIGAVMLAAKACLHSGSGLVTTYVPKCGYLPMQSNVPEAMVLTDRSEEYISSIDFEGTISVIGLGVGIGTREETVQAFSAFLKKNKLPLVIDADGLNILSKNKQLLKKLPSLTVLTPHPKELERLIGTWEDDYDKLRKAHIFSNTYNCILVLKGAHTITLYQDKGYVNTTGNPGMATGGSGDVLTGIITGLMAQKYEPLQAAIFGVYLHGRAGDIAVESTGYQALTASDIINALGKAFIDLFTLPETDQKEEVSPEGTSE